MPLDHYFPLKETTVFVVVQSLLSEKVGFLFGLCVLQVFFMLGYPLLLFFLGCAMVLIHLLHKKKNKGKTMPVSLAKEIIIVYCNGRLNYLESK